MFSASIQPQTISLFSSTGSNPLQLFSAHSDGELPSDSFVHLLRDRTSEPSPKEPAVLISQPTLSGSGSDEDDFGPGYLLDQTVLHIQSPTLRKAYIRCPPQPQRTSGTETGRQTEKEKELGLKHPWVHLQVRNMGRDWSFEVGVSDQLGQSGILRFSTFQKQTRIKIPDKPSLPLLHIPLSFPLPSSGPLTPWCTVSFHLPTFMPFFSTQAKMFAQTASSDTEEAEAGAGPFRSAAVPASYNVPNGKYGHITYVKVYSTCRLRRIWVSEGGPGQKVPWEFELYASE